MESLNYGHFISRRGGTMRWPTHTYRACMRMRKPVSVASTTDVHHSLRLMIQVGTAKICYAYDIGGEFL